MKSNNTDNPKPPEILVEGTQPQDDVDHGVNSSISRPTRSTSSLDALDVLRAQESSRVAEQ